MYSRPLTLDAYGYMHLCYSHFAYELSTMELENILDKNGLTTDNVCKGSILSVVILGTLCFVFVLFCFLFVFFCARQLSPSPGRPNAVNKA